MAKKILMPEDEEIRKILETSFFHRAGFEFLTVKDSGEAFRIIEEHDPELAILDYTMAGLDGDPCCQKIKADPVLRNTPILMIIPEDVKNNSEKCRELHCDSVVSRPVDAQRFLTAASHLLGIFDRAAPRIETFIMVSCGAGMDELHEGAIRNINLGGAFIETEELLPVDYRMVVQFELEEGGDLISSKARVAWVNHPEWIKCEKLPAGMGVEFIDLDETSLDLIKAYIDKQMAKRDG